jgi:Fe-S-cluster-containing dehydrogenase component
LAVNSEVKAVPGAKYSPELNIPPKEGTVSKCIFCPDKLRKGELPRCAEACPMGVIYFGDLIEDVVTNGAETVRFSELIRERAGYRHLENLGTEPSVYYLPPVARLFPVDRGYDGLKPDIKERFKDVPYVINKEKKK